MRSTCSPADVGDIGNRHGRGGEEDSEARRQQRARVLFQPRATRSSGNRIHWIDAFLNLMEELGIECLVGHPAEIRAAEPRKQKHSRRDADLLLSLLVEERFPAIWLPTKELLDLRALLRHRHQWVRLRVKIHNAL